MRKTYALLLLSGMLFFGCSIRRDEKTSRGPYTGVFPASPVNLSDINSPYDDYNSNTPIVGSTFPLVFSSNRKTAKDFDFVYKGMSALYNNTDPNRIIEVTENTSLTNGAYLFDKNIYDVLAVNSSADELGPYLVSLGRVEVKNAQGQSIPNNRYAFLYATNQSGNLDIRFIEDATTGSYSAPKDISFLNSPKDDAYPSIMGDTSAIYFCSNRNGDFDIFKADISTSTNGFLNKLQETGTKTVTKDLVLSSASDDKCPFILGNLLIFTSNRPGGYGGFDLYYSKRVNGQWSAPVNFGDTINTSADEYRPIILTNSQMYANDMMIFSSNRSGGKGGFDLYYVGIERMTK